MTRYSHEAEPIEVTIRVLRQSEKALLVDHGAKEQCWIPKSQITDWCPNVSIEKATSIFIPEWLAKEKGMI